MIRALRLAALPIVLAAFCAPACAAPRNALIFVADGLRYDSVTPRTAPTLWKLRRDGVDFTNSHALYPTITTVNASAIATGHDIGDTGNFGNTLYAGFASPEAGGAEITFLENDVVLGEMNDHFGGNYLNEESLLAAARRAGFSTAAIGKTGPTAIQDVTARDGASTIVIDDSVGTPTGIAVSPDVAAAVAEAGLPPTAPKTALPNVEQQGYLLAIVTRVLLPRFKKAGKPFVLLFWSRDPDATQHGQKDSLGKLIPGINSPTAKAGIRNADGSLAVLLAALKAMKLDGTTDVFVTADHGFSTIAKHSSTSAAARYEEAGGPFGDVDTRNAPPPIGQRDLPPGFLAIDLADALALPLTDPHTKKVVNYKQGEHPGFGNGLIGDPAHPFAIVAANGGSDHIWLTGSEQRARAEKIVRILMKQDYVSGIFVNDALGDIAGTLAMSAIDLRGTARTPAPAIVVNFRSFAVPGCKPLLMCAAEVADTSLASGQGMHGTFSRADTRNFMAAFGPDFKSRFADPAPIGNADVAPTLARLLGLKIVPKGGLGGRIVSEALCGGKPVAFAHGRSVSAPGEGGLETVLDYQRVGNTRYFDAAGFAGRTVGLSGH